MKNILLFTIIFIITPVLIFPFSESGISLGFGFDMSFNDFNNNGEDISSFLASPGITINSFVFLKENKFGLFVHGLLVAFPNSISITRNNMSEKREFNLGLQSGLVLGPGFRLNINENLVFQTGIGVNFEVVITDFTEFVQFYNKTVSFETGCIDLGIGGDIGLRYRITRDLILNFGMVFSLDFFRYIIIQASDERLTSSGRADNFFQFSLRPYISFGVNLYW